MLHLNKNIISNLTKEFYKNPLLLEDTIVFKLKNNINESGGISTLVVKETNKIIRLIKKNLKNNSVHKILNHGIGQYKTIFHGFLFEDKYKFSVSIINYHYIEIWREKHKKYAPKSRANIDPINKVITINSDAIEMEIQPTTFEGSLQHEIQHYYEVEKSHYSWATDDTYKLALYLLSNDDKYLEKDEPLKERIYLIGLLLYMSFKQEQEGYANGLFAFLKHCGYKIDRDNVDYLSKRDESFTILKYMEILEDVLNGVTNDTRINDAINYVNNCSKNIKHSRNSLLKILNKVKKDFSKKINRVKMEVISPNDVYENNIHINYHLGDYIPFNYKK